MGVVGLPDGEKSGSVWLMGCHYYIPGGKYPPCNSERMVAWLDVRYPRMWAVDMIEIVDTELASEFCALAACKGKVMTH